MGNRFEGRTYWWRTPPFHFSYEYDGKEFEYDLWNGMCFEEDESCIESSKIWTLWSWIIGIILICILCSLSCYKVMKNRRGREAANPSVNSLK